MIKLGIVCIATLFFQMNEGCKGNFWRPQSLLYLMPVTVEYMPEWQQPPSSCVTQKMTAEQEKKQAEEELKKAREERNAARIYMTHFFLSYREREQKSELPSLPKEMINHIGTFLGLPQAELEEGLKKLQQIKVASEKPSQEGGGE